MPLSALEENVPFAYMLVNFCISPPIFLPAPDRSLSMLILPLLSGPQTSGLLIADDLGVRPGCSWLEDALWLMRAGRCPTNDGEVLL